MRGRDYALDPHVVSTNIPNELRHCYNQTGDGHEWTLDISKCSPEVRDYFPNLKESWNKTEWEELSEWQRALYTWDGERKYVLTGNNAAWHVEEPLDAHYETMESGHG